MESIMNEVGSEKIRAFQFLFNGPIKNRFHLDCLKHFFNHRDSIRVCHNITPLVLLISYFHCRFIGQFITGIQSVPHQKAHLHATSTGTELNHWHAEHQLPLLLVYSSSSTPCGRIWLLDEQKTRGLVLVLHYTFTSLLSAHFLASPPSIVGRQAGRQAVTPYFRKSDSFQWVPTRRLTCWHAQFKKSRDV